MSSRPRKGLASGTEAADSRAAESALQLIQRGYSAFNRGEYEVALGVMCEDVDWHDTWTHSRRRGRTAVRAYWRRLTLTLIPRVEVLALAVPTPRQILADAHLLVYDTSNKLLAETEVRHSFRLGEDGLIARMDARAPRLGEPSAGRRAGS